MRTGEGTGGDKDSTRGEQAMTAWPLGLSGWGARELARGSVRDMNGLRDGRQEVEVEKWVWSSGDTFRWSKPQKWLWGLSTRKAGSQESGGQQGCPQDGEPGERTELGRARPRLHFVRIPVAPPILHLVEP